MSKRNFPAELEKADQAIAAFGLPQDVDRRIRLRLEKRRGGERSVRQARVALAGLFTIAVCAALVLLIRPRFVGSRPTQLGGLSVVLASPDLKTRVSPDQTIEIEAGGCTLVDRVWGTSFALVAPARLRREVEGVRVVSGTVEVTVEKRLRTAGVARIFVSHGTIEVMGTRFTIEQRIDSGSVTLHEGAIVFRSPDSEAVFLHPIETLGWPLVRSALPAAAPPASPTAPALRDLAHDSKPHRAEVVSRPAPESNSSDAPSVEEILDQISLLRSRGLYEESVTELSKALSRDLRPSTRERLSFELGSILTYQLTDPARACTHWLDHRRLYPTGRYDAEIEQAARSLQCPSAR